jgi:DNA polymerase-3 subunit epsilon/oligoribonuclease
MDAIFLDIETTGLDPFKHRAIDLACKIVNLNSGDIQGRYQSIIKHPPSVWDQRDPSSIEVNGYTWEQVETGKPVELVRQEILQFFSSLKIERGKAVFICQNPAFDRGFFTQIVDIYTQERLNWPYHWLDLASMYWAMHSLYLKEMSLPLPEKMNLSKNEIAKEYMIPPEPHPHRAMNGVDHLITCYQAVLGVHFN